jgi:hypothetical protein
VVGAPGDDLPAVSGAGSARVFVRNGQTWTQQAMLIASSPMNGGHFGNSLALDHDSVVIGTDYGASTAYVFVRTAGVWTQQAILVGPNGGGFGRDVGLDGDTAVIGADFEDHSGVLDAGAAHVIVRSNGTWMEQRKLMAAEPMPAFDHFGRAVAIKGSRVLVGAQDDDAAGLISTGSAYVFISSGGAWVEQIRLIAFDQAAEAWFGAGVAIDGDVAVIAAPHADPAGLTDAGSVYVFDLAAVPGDPDCDGDIDLDDHVAFVVCMSGPGGGLGPGCASADLDGDGDADLGDFTAFENLFIEP